jgi:hypothetical protein
LQKVWEDDDDWGWARAREKGGCECELCCEFWASAGLPSMESRLGESVGRDGGGADESKRERAGELEYLRGDERLFERTRGRTVHSVFIVGDNDGLCLISAHPAGHFRAVTWGLLRRAPDCRRPGRLPECSRNGTLRKVT